MTVNAIRLQNFMGFQDTGWVELRSINLLFGRNSTGKSAILRALLLLRQSLDSRPEDGPLIFVAEDGQDFGGFQQMVFGQQMHNNMSFGFRCAFAPTIYSDENNSEATHSQEAQIASKQVRGVRYGDRAGDLLDEIGVEAHLSTVEDRTFIVVDFGLHFSYSPESNLVKLVKVEIKDQNELSILLAVSPNPPTEREWTFTTEYPKLAAASENEYASEDSEKVLYNSELILLQGFMPRLHVLDSAVPLPVEGGDENSPREYHSLPFKRCSSLLEELRKDVTKFLLTIQYLGPLRAEPLRYYYVAGQPGNRLDAQGRHVVQTYLAGQRNQANQDRLDQINHWLDDAGVGKRLVFKPVNQQETLYEVELVENLGTQSLQPNLREVGFGVSQVLPVLIQAMLAPAGSMVMIEQPELHLHPAAQAELGDLFIAATKFGVRFLIETHSEHLLLRLRSRITKSRLRTLEQVEEISNALVHKVEPPDDFRREHLSLYFVERIHHESYIHTIEIDEQGQYQSVPEGFRRFFSDDYDEVMQMNLDLAKIFELGAKHEDRG